jgi:ATP-dependent helicase/nuclease subunit A
VDMAAPAVPDVEQVRAWYPGVTDEELALIGRLVEAYCSSRLARRIASLPGVEPERAFAFEHDGVLLHGRLDLLHRSGGRALVVDYKTNVLDDESPADVVEREYRLQRLVYALVCLRAGAEEVEVVYHFLERPDEPVGTTFVAEDADRLGEELSAAIARIERGDFRPTPSEFSCAGCPALDRVCAGPALRERPGAPALVAAR